MKKSVTCFFIVIYSLTSLAEDLNNEDIKSNSKYYGFHLGILSYISFETEITPEDKILDRFKITRGYLSIKKDLFDFLSFRMTFDLYDDEDGAEERVKYLYAKFHLGDLSILTQNSLQFGITQTPWIDFAEHLNFYRMQGTLPLEKNDIYVSSDFGLSYNCLIGGKIDEEYQNKINKNYPGKYGSITLGVYNGCGYSKFEMNSLLTLQGRITLRPLPEFIPGLQLSYYGIWGHGNYNEKYNINPPWQTNLLAISYENSLLTILGEIFFGKGDYKAAIVDDKGNPLNYRGYSLFIEGKFIKKIKLFGRFDFFNRNIEQAENYKLEFISGIGYDFGNQNILLLDYDYIHYENEIEKDLKLIKLTMQINFND
ncbi:MAG: hypothetical protein QXG00_07915 [Candidatus Woesearchaeota archaeon]